MWQFAIGVFGMLWKAAVIVALGFAFAGCCKLHTLFWRHFNKVK